MIGQQDPGGDQETPPRTHGIEAARQTSKVPLHQIPARRQQFHGDEKKRSERKGRRSRDMKGQGTGRTRVFKQ